MKYTTTVIIKGSRNEVIQKIASPEDMKHWQRGLKNYKLLEGTPGHKGATMELYYVMGKRKMMLTETILENRFPDELHASYTTKGVKNIQKNYFKEISPDTTEWLSESEFQFQGFGMKVMGWLMPNAFKKQSLKYMEDFKNFVEQGISVAENP